MLQIIIILTLLLSFAKSDVLNCCEKDNKLNLTSRRCVDGNHKNNFTCGMYIRKASEGKITLYKEDGVLNTDGVNITKKEFCVTEDLNGEKMFLICFLEETLEFQNSYSVLQRIVIVFSLISVFFLILTIIVYCIMPKLIDLQATCFLHSIFGLAIAYFVLNLVKLHVPVSDVLCHFYAYTVYFSWLYTFFWFNAFSFHIFRTTVNLKMFSSKRVNWKILYYVYGSGCPLVLLGILLVSHHTDFYAIAPGIGIGSCWFSTIEATFVYFYGPIAFLLLCNVLYLIGTTLGLSKNSEKYDGRKLKTMRYRFFLCLKLYVVMGISWIFELLSAMFDPSGTNLFFQITDVLNSMQGIFIFFVLVIGRKRVKIMLAKYKYFGTIFPSQWQTIQDDEESDLNEEDFGHDLPEVRSEAPEIKKNDSPLEKY